MMKTFKFNDKTQLTAHFNVSEFRCKCGGSHDTQLDEVLVQKLEQLFSALNCSKIIVNSGYRCTAHDKNVGGNGYGQHTKGTAADIVCYDKNGKKISSKIVCCAAQDIGFGGIANIDSTYTATHVDTRTSLKRYGDEAVPGGTNGNVTNNFYEYYGIGIDNNDKQDHISVLQKILNAKGANLVVDGVAGDKTINECKKYIIEIGDKGELTKWVQERLNSLGFSCGAADGIAGKNTMSAISKWQKANQLGEGYLGGGDWRVLLQKTN